MQIAFNQAQVSTLSPPKQMITQWLNTLPKKQNQESKNMIANLAPNDTYPQEQQLTSKL